MWILVLAQLLPACNSTLVIGSYACEEPASNSTGGAATDTNETGFTLPWSTGFEDGFCGYSQPEGFCYLRGASTFKIVSEPVHSGQYAAAFTVVADGAETGTQARCVRQGKLPIEAYYGAWYFIPSASENTGLWNLIHFQGSDSPGETMHNLWDISLVDNGSGGLRLSVYDTVNAQVRDPSGAPAIPIGSWFHIEVYLKRAADATGAFSLYQDDEPLVEVTGLITDDSSWGQWYVGNLATNLAPAESTLYVDDVTVKTTR